MLLRIAGTSVVLTDCLWAFWICEKAGLEYELPQGRVKFSASDTALPED